MLLKIFSISTKYLLAFFFFLYVPQAIASGPSTSSLKNDQGLVYKNIIESVSEDGSLATLDNGMSFAIDWWYRSIPKEWSVGKQIYIFFDFQSNQYKLEDPLSGSIAWATLKSFPKFSNTIKSLANGMGDQDAYSKITLDNGYSFRGIENLIFAQWEVHSPVAILANPDGLYQIWNFKLNEIALCSLASTSSLNRNPIEIKDIFFLEDRLNHKVLEQTEATKALTHSLLIYQTGLKEKEKPIGVYLFLGPTGVGKTELAKALAFEIYDDPLAILHFDMGHFTEYDSITLTSLLQQNPQKIVLFDGLEKAHPQIIKRLLPVFDEGFILDGKNNRIPCSDTIFIMTSHLCSQEISQLYQANCSEKAILEKIEPTLMEVLSPEIYQCVQPILFKPLEREAMSSLVELMLNNVRQRVEVEKKIQLYFDDSLKSFLIERGYNPLFGARPLKKLIDQEVLVALANYIIKKDFEEYSDIVLFYDGDSDSVKCIAR